MSYVARLILESDFVWQFWFSPPNPKNADTTPKRLAFSALASSPLLSSALVFSGLLVALRHSRRPPSVFFLVRVFFHSGLGFWSSLWFTISFCLVKVSSFTWFSLKRKCFWWFKYWCPMICVWGLGLRSKGCSFMVLLWKGNTFIWFEGLGFEEDLYLYDFYYIKSLRLWCLKIFVWCLWFFRWLYGEKKDGLCFVLILQLFVVLNEFVVESVNTKKFFLHRQNCGHVVPSLHNS